MEDVLNDCVKQKGCQMGTLLASYKRLLRANADQQMTDGSDDAGVTMDAGGVAAATCPRPRAPPRC
jgi:membrane-bound lytic murein transglycosylase D